MSLPRTYSWYVLTSTLQTCISLINFTPVQSLADVKRQLAALESEELAKGVVLNEMSSSTYISSVILLEDQQ